jgi:hypothetical protein
MSRLYLFIYLLFFVAACNESRPEEINEENTTALPPQYHYFPKANVYFDSANKDYLFLSNDSGRWQSAKQIPAVVLALMDKSVQIQNPPDPVWRDNENHRLVYSALLYATPTDTVAKKKVVKQLPKQTKPVVDSAALEVKEKKGVGKFFQKIFGRKKREKKEDESQQ